MFCGRNGRSADNWRTIQEDRFYVKKYGRKNENLDGSFKKTAYLELSGLVEKGLLSSTGKGRSVKYVAGF